MIKRKINFELTVDEEKISELYPNYKFSFENVEQFISFIKNSLLDSISEDNIEKFGYTIEKV